MWPQIFSRLWKSLTFDVSGKSSCWCCSVVLRKINEMLPIVPSSSTFIALELFQGALQVKEVQLAAVWVCCHFHKNYGAHNQYLLTRAKVFLNAKFWTSNYSTWQPASLLITFNYFVFYNFWVLDNLLHSRVVCLDKNCPLIRIQKSCVASQGAFLMHNGFQELVTNTFILSRQKKSTVARPDKAFL